MFSRKKNTYVATKVLYGSGEKYNSNIHHTTLKVNQYVWDMMKVLEKEELYGFKIESKIGAKKILVILNHTDADILKEAHGVLKNFHNNDEIVFLTKVSKEKENNFIRNSYITLIILALLAAILYGSYYWSQQQNLNFSLEEKEFKIKESNEEEIVIQKIEIDPEKLLKLQEVFVDDAKSDDIKKIMTIGTNIISMSVSDEEKAKYSSEALVQNFKGKSGFQFVLKEGNDTKSFEENVEKLSKFSQGFIAENHKEMSKIVNSKLKESNQSSSQALNSILQESKRFQNFLTEENGTKSLDVNLQEIHGYAKAAIEQNNIEMAKACYTKALNDFNLSSEEKGFAFIQQAVLNLDQNDSLNAEKNYNLALMLYQNLSNEDFVNFSLQEGWLLEQLSELETDKKVQEELLKKVESIYLKRIKKLRKSSKKSSKEKLAKALYYLSNFYFTHKHDLKQTLKLNSEALALYKKSKTEISSDYLNVLYGLANKYNVLEKFNKSEKLYLSLLKSLRKSNKNEDSIAKVLHKLGNLYTKMEDFKKSELHYKKALEIYEKLIATNYRQYKPIALKLEHDIALYEQKIEEFKKAEERYVSILKTYQELSKKMTEHNLDMAKIWNSYAKVLFTQKSFAIKNLSKIKQAERYLKNALILSGEVLHQKYREASKIQSKSYFYLALLSNLQKNSSETKMNYVKALEKDNSLLISLHYAKFLKDAEEYLEGQKLYESLLKNHNAKETLAKILLEYGKSYLKISKEASIRRLKKSLKLYQALSKKYTKAYKEIQEVENILKSISSEA